MVKEFRHYRPLTNAVDRFVREAQEGERIFTGIDVLDRQMRGIGKGHFCMIVGASHAGKSQILLQVLKHNKDRRVCFFVPDEPDTLVLAKLAALETGVSAEFLEAEVAARNQTYIDLLMDVAEGAYPNLIVFDQMIDPEGMDAAYDEARHVWGAEPELVIFDYVQLLRGPETVPGQMDFLKGFGTRKRIPMIALHQTSRTGGKEGQEIDITSGSYGGEQHATFLIGVRRKVTALAAERKELRNKILRSGKPADHDRLIELEHDMLIHANTLTINLVKCKRPGGQKVDDTDFEILNPSGAIVPIGDGDLPSQYLASLPTRKVYNDPNPDNPQGYSVSYIQTEMAT